MTPGQSAASTARILSTGQAWKPNRQGVGSDKIGAEPVNLLVADRDIQSGIAQCNPFGLLSDSFVLQGGDPWGFDNGDDYAESQAYGVCVFSQPAPEPGTSPLLLSRLMPGSCHDIPSAGS